MYLLPAIDILDGKAVRLAKGDYAQVTIYNDNPVEQAKRFEDEGASWIHVVDLDGAKSGRPENAAIVERIASATSLHVEVGGGIRSMATLASFSDAGAARMVLGTALANDPDFAREAIERYGDALAAGIDAKGGEAKVAGWREGSGRDARELARQVAAMGYAHLIYTDIARDGMRVGIDPAAYAAMAEAFGHPVIASGGVAGAADIEALAGIADCVEGVIAGRAIYEGSLGVAEGVAACARATS